MTWVSCSSWLALVCHHITASPPLAVVFIHTQITASCFQLSIFLLWSVRNAYRCLSRGELQAKSRQSRGRWRKLRSGRTHKAIFINYLKFDKHPNWIIHFLNAMLLSLVLFTYCRCWYILGLFKFPLVKLFDKQNTQLCWTHKFAERWRWRKHPKLHSKCVRS